MYKIKPHSEHRNLSTKNLEEIFSSLLQCTLDKPQYSKTSKNLVIYGAGSLGQMTKEFLDYLNIPIQFIVDTNAKEKRTERYWKGKKLLLPEEVPPEIKRNYNLLLCIVTSALVPIKTRLEKEGWNSIVPAYDFLQNFSSCHPLNNGWLAKLKKEDISRVKKVFRGLSDVKSQKYYTQFLAWRIARSEISFRGSPVNIDNRYFIPEVENIISDNEIFVDAGAYDGTIINRFVKMVNGKYKKIYAVEADRRNLNKLRKNTAHLERISVIPYALSNKTETKKFYGGFGFASKVDCRGTASVPTLSLDSLNIPASLIKLHLEGGELEALKGAVKAIRRNRPIIMTTIYHNSDGLWKIPLFIMGVANNYRHYVRLHSWAGTGVVYYAIPNERINRKKKG